MEDQLPGELQRALEPDALARLIRALAGESEPGATGVPVASITGQLIAPYGLKGPERARLYQAVRAALRQRIERMEGLQYVAGLT